MVLAVAAPVCALAFQIETLASAGCHERLARVAIDGVSWPGARPRLEATALDRALAASVAFAVPPTADGWTLSVLLGVRDNDLHGAALLDLPDLVVVHNANDYQDEHCLRGPGDDGPEGDVTALASCRAFIVREVELALGSDEEVDLDAIENVRVALTWETRAQPLQRFGFRMGRAMHALQDSFTHALRSEDEQRVLTVLNWVDPVLAIDYSPARDGWMHQSSLDACDGAGQTATRVAAAALASRELFRAVSEATGRAARLEAAATVLDHWLQYEPGCDASNDFCGRAVPMAGCSSTDASSSLPVLGLLLLLGARRRRSRVPAPLVAALLLVGPMASAQELSATGSEPVPRRFSLHAAVGASIDRGGGTVAVGGGVALGPHVRLRLDVELNPWLDTFSGRLAPGAASVYGTFGWCWAEFGRVELVSSVSLGGSALLFTTPGAEAGSVGLFAGASMLRVGVRLREHLALEFNPEAVVAVPSLKGVPLAYRQYRATVGLRWDL